MKNTLHCLFSPKKLSNDDQPSQAYFEKVERIYNIQKRYNESRK
jgi:hypothetical protein